MSKALTDILESPLVTEKSVRLSQQGHYTFRCRPAANKIEIRQAIEELFDVKVASVNTSMVKGHRRQVGRARPGKKADWKKAIVKLTAESKANRLKEIFEGA